MMTMQVQTVLVALALQCSAAVALPAVGPAPFPATMAALYSQYHAQDELGRYSFGYSGPASSKHEHKSADGVTSGSYSYMDPYGVMQTRAYTADDVNGFRVAASDLPSMPAGPAMDSAMGRAMSPAMSPVMGRAMGPAMSPAMDSAMGRAMGPAMGASGPASGRRIYSPGYATDWQTDGSLTRWSLTNLEHANIPEAEAHYPYNTMEQRYLAAPPAHHQPMELPGGLKSQFHAQDELGQYTYGYANENAAKMETKTADGVTRGSFSYMDPSGRPQSRSYVADDAGFRVVASDLPQMPQPSKAA